jgi:N-dimethylarginine dimethylaminohydrolase
MVESMTCPSGILICPPTYFDVVDRKNPFMTMQTPVDQANALRQWQALRQTFAETGMQVHEYPPLRGAEDMVFSANPALAGLNRNGNRVAVASRMKFPSRRVEVPAITESLTLLGYAVDTSIPDSVWFEGGGDAVWHPGRHVLYAGYGWRSDAASHPFLERIFGAEIVPLRLVDERFYHLDTALCAVDSDTALIVADAFDQRGIDELQRRFGRLLRIDQDEALSMAANAAPGADGSVIIDCAALQTIAMLESLDYTVRTVDTSEFRKSGGSVYCMKQYLY